MLLDTYAWVADQLKPTDVVTCAIDAAPKPIQSVRFSARSGYVQTFQPKANKDWKRMIKLSVAEQLSPGWTPFEDTPLWVRTVYVFPTLKSFTKRERQLIAEGCVLFKYTKPDVNDNLNKGLYDALTGVVWDDDSRVAFAESFKLYGKEAGIIVSVGKLPKVMRKGVEDGIH